MTRYFIVDDDVIIGESSQGIAYEGKKPSSYLRYVGGKFIDVSKRSQFYIDTAGRKHSIQKDGWQELACRVDDEIEFKNNQWQLLDAFPYLKAEALSEVSIIADRYHEKISNASSAKIARYEVKAQAARLYLSGKATKKQQVRIEKQAAMRGLTAQRHVEAILQKRFIFEDAAEEIDNIETYAATAIKAAKTIEELEAIRAEIPIEAEKAFKLWQDGLAVLRAG